MAVNRTFDLWTEGFQEMDSLVTPALRLGIVKAKNIDEAISKLRDKSDNPSLFNLERRTYWGLRIFENPNY